MFKNKPKMAKEFAHHSGKGTKARLNTASEKHLFNSKQSK